MSPARMVAVTANFCQRSKTASASRSRCRAKGSRSLPPVLPHRPQWSDRWSKSISGMGVPFWKRRARSSAVPSSTAAHCTSNRPPRLQIQTYQSLYSQPPQKALPALTMDKSLRSKRRHRPAQRGRAKFFIRASFAHEMQPRQSGPLIGRRQKSKASSDSGRRLRRAASPRAHRPIARSCWSVL